MFGRVYTRSQWDARYRKQGIPKDRVPSLPSFPVIPFQHAVFPQQPPLDSGKLRKRAGRQGLVPVSGGGVIVPEVVCVTMLDGHADGLLEEHRVFNEESDLFSLQLM